MHKISVVVFTAFALIFTACNNQPKINAGHTKPARIVIHFELDSAGNLTDAVAKKQLEELAVKISSNADRVIMFSYTEKQDSVGKDKELATIRAAAAKAVMFAAAKERIYYGVGIDARGFEAPVVKDPYSIKNRRIEIEYLP